MEGSERESRGRPVMRLDVGLPTEIVTVESDR
jgi:hypothetical protein